MDALPAFSEPDPRGGKLANNIVHFARTLRTAGLRMERSSENAAALAGFFAGRTELSAVHYPGLRGRRDAALAQSLLPRGRGAMLTIELRGARAKEADCIRPTSWLPLNPAPEQQA